MISCVSGKRIYASLTLAEDALIGARTRFEFAEGQGPVAVYQCEDCGCFHLTSQGEVNARLAELMASGKLTRQREADAWERKLRK